MEKEFKVFLLSLLLLSGCQKENTNEANYSQTFADKNSKTALTVINEAINDINDGSIETILANNYSKSIIIPLDIDNIAQLNDINQCTPTTDKHSNAEYIGVCPVNDKYDMEISIYSLDEDFWNNGSITFISKDTNDTSSQYSSEKKLLDTLLPQRLDTLDHLFGHDINCENEIDEQGYCLINVDDSQQYIDDLISDVQQVFSKQYIQQYNELLFTSDSPIWKIEDNKLYVNTYVNLNYNLLDYSTNNIVATKYEDSYLYINILVAYETVIDNTVHQITLYDDGNGYKLLTME